MICNDITRCHRFLLHKGRPLAYLLFVRTHAASTPQKSSNYESRCVTKLFQSHRVLQLEQHRATICSKVSGGSSCLNRKKKRPQWVPRLALPAEVHVEVVKLRHVVHEHPELILGHTVHVVDCLHALPAEANGISIKFSQSPINSTLGYNLAGVPCTFTGWNWTITDYCFLSLSGRRRGPEGG